MNVLVVNLCRMNALGDLSFRTCVLDARHHVMDVSHDQRYALDVNRESLKQNLMDVSRGRTNELDDHHQTCVQGVNHHRVNHALDVSRESLMQIVSCELVVLVTSRDAYRHRVPGVHRVNHESLPRSVMNAVGGLPRTCVLDVNSFRNDDR